MWLVCSIADDRVKIILIHDPTSDFVFEYTARAIKTATEPKPKN